MATATQVVETAQAEFERKEKIHADLEQQTALLAEQTELQKQAPQAPGPRVPGASMADDVIPGIGLSVGELERLVKTQLASHPDEEQPVTEDAPKRIAAVLGDQIAELLVRRKRARTEAAAGAEAAPAAAGGAEGLEERQAGGVSPNAVAGGAAPPAPATWDPESVDIEKLRIDMCPFGPVEECPAELLARCKRLAKCGFSPY